MVCNPNGAALSRLQEKTSRLDLAMETDREGKYQKRMRYLTQLFYNATRHQKCKSGIVEEDEEVIFSFEETPVSIERLELEAKKKDDKRSGAKESPSQEETGADDVQKTAVPPSECQKRVVCVTSKKDKANLAGIDEFVLIPASPKKKRAVSEEPERSETKVDQKRRKIATAVSKLPAPPTPPPRLNRPPLDPFSYTQPWLDGLTSSPWQVLNRHSLLSSLPTSLPTMLENSTHLLNKLLRSSIFQVLARTNCPTVLKAGQQAAPGSRRLSRSPFIRPASRWPPAILALWKSLSSQSLSQHLALQGGFNPQPWSSFSLGCLQLKTHKRERQGDCCKHFPDSGIYILEISRV